MTDTQFLDLVETYRTEEASISRLFAGDGAPIRGRRQDPRYTEQLAEAAEFLDGVYSGRTPMHRLAEAMTTSDFPLLFGDILDRQLLARYRETPAVYRNFVRVRTVRDFREVKRFAVDGAEGTLDPVAEKAPYPAEALDETADSYRVQKRGRRIHLSWEALVNDDLDAFRENPDRLARAARRSEQRFVTEMYVDSTGPHASLYDVTLGNVVTGNPVLSIEGLQTAMGVLAGMVDEDGEPIAIESVELVVPPALEIVAQNILNAIHIDLSGAGGTSSQVMRAQNWMRGRVRLSVDPYIPLVANSSNGSTSWFLFANPESSRPALELGFLRGHEAPALFAKAPDAIRIGGSGGSDIDADFDTDSRQWKVRHVFGGARLLNTGGYRATVASDGSGS